MYIIVIDWTQLKDRGRIIHLFSSRSREKKEKDNKKRVKIYQTNQFN
jgi:hypothetical protein